MVAAAVAAEPGAANVADLCRRVVESSADIGSLYDEIGALKSERAADLQALLLAVGRDMLSRGQKSKRVGEFLIQVGVTKIRICDCHGAYLDTCDTIGPITVLDRGYEPYIRVRDLRGPVEAAL